MQIYESMEELARSNGADFFGAADLGTAKDFIVQQGGAACADFPYAVSIGIELIHSIVDLLPRRAEKAIAMSYRQHCYDIINRRLDSIASRVSSELQNLGHSAFPVPASQIIDTDKLTAIFSHKLAAHLAGLGWIGKSCLLVTPDAGPRVRWASVLTDAPLEATGSPMDERCGDCQECVKACPKDAFTGRNFKHNESRDMRYDAQKCKEYHDSLKDKLGVATCGMCIYICPYGRKASTSSP